MNLTKSQFLGQLEKAIHKEHVKDLIKNHVNVCFYMRIDAKPGRAQMTLGVIHQDMIIFEVIQEKTRAEIQEKLTAPFKPSKALAYIPQVTGTSKKNRFINLQLALACGILKQKSTPVPVCVKIGPNRYRDETRNNLTTGQALQANDFDEITLCELF